MSEYDEGSPAPWGRDSHERHEPYEWHEPTDPRGHDEDHHEQHAGNATVNHRPDDHGRHEAEPERAAAGRDGIGAIADRTDAGRDRLVAALEGNGGEPRTGPAAEGLGEDEQALRLLLHQAVREIEPGDGTLEHLRRAVPARRARKRQAVVGMAAAALFFGTAIPALVHVADTTGSDVDPSIAGQVSQADNGTTRGKDTDGGSNSSDGTSSTSKDAGQDGQKTKKDKGRGASVGATGDAGPSASPQSAPACMPAQLGGATATEGTPDSAGAVYGTFHVANVSTKACTVSGAGSVTTAVQGAADASKISVATHVTTDAATGLPDPAKEVTSLVLKPGDAYEVKFAWIPSETCPTTGGSTGPAPEPSPSDTPSTGGGTNAESGGTTPQLMREDGAADGSVTISHTSATGTGTSTATISNACAGTVYRTGLLPAS
ncbi:hypothetical protein ABZ845_30125 [Streptomyces sp. NPDC047022]|uniref:hypothetical protein n=1 Tax=Streptomyces sp. NPDC047022 TaxID=3155737 RepID=UPI0033C0B6D2